MRVISPLDLRRSLGAILDAASAGERFLVERDRRPLAMLVSVEDGYRLEPDPAEARARRLAALARLEGLAGRLGEGPRAELSRGHAAPADATPPDSLAGPGPAPSPPPTRHAAPRPAADAGSPGPGPAPSPRPTAASPVGRTADRYEAERRRHAAERDVVAGG